MNKKVAKHFFNSDKTINTGNQKTLVVKDGQVNIGPMLKVSIYKLNIFNILKNVTDKKNVTYKYWYYGSIFNRLIPI